MYLSLPRRFVFVLVILVLLLQSGLAASAATKGLSPRDLTRLAADQIMANKLEAGLYGADLFRKLSADPNSSGPVKDLAALGPTLKVTEADSQSLPGGRVYLMVIKHERGYSAWNIGISSRTKVIEYLSFNTGDGKGKGSGSSSPPAASPPAAKPQPAAPSAGGSSGGGGAASTSAACQKFPNLC